MPDDLAIIVDAGCKKSSNSCSIPNVLVDIHIYTTDPAFFKLNAIGGWVYITGGVHGIIVYHQNVDTYMAYDRNCTYQPSNATAVVQVDTSTNITAIDKSCGSKFGIYDGSVIQGPAACGLKQYSTSLNGSDLHIYSQ